MLRDNLSQIKKVFEQPGKFYGQSKKQIMSFSATHSNTALLFLPGAFLFLLAAVAVFAPMILVTAVAVFLLLFATLFTVVAFKLLKLKRKFDDVTKQFQGKLFIQGVEIVDGDGNVLQESSLFRDGDIFDEGEEFETEIDEQSDSDEDPLNKKIILH